MHLRGIVEPARRIGWEQLRRLDWLQRPVLVRTAAAWCALTSLFLALVAANTPSPGTVFERDALAGTYHCCSAGGRYSESRVAHHVVNCVPINYFLFNGTGRNDCGFANELAGKTVTVERALIPSLPTGHRVVVRIATDNLVFLDRSDDFVRQAWIRSSMRSAISAPLLISLILYLCQVLLSPSNRARLNNG